MTREWKPGDVVALQVDDGCFVGRGEIVALMEELIRWWPRRPSHEVGMAGGTAHLEFVARSLRNAQVGPLVVLDIVKNEYVLPALKAHIERTRKCCGFPLVIDDIVQQIEAQTSPPKPPEPQGLGAVVEDAEGACWTRFAREYDFDAHWSHETATKGNRAYADINAVRVLSEGVTP